ncbi:MAG: sugar phosphate nucleotidyltransferase [Thermodesulfobacteriota bacterium]
MSSHRPPRVKALIPAAGRGRRLADISGGSHKELLRLGPLTLIEHCLRMVLASGVTEVAVVVRPGKEEVLRVVEEYWSREGPDFGELVFLEQDPPRGVAEAMLLAADFAGTDPLAVVMPDNLLVGGPPALGQMIEGLARTGENLIGVIPLPPWRAGLFGNVGLITLAPARPGDLPRVATFTQKAPGVLKLSGEGPFYKGMIGVIYRPGWATRAKALAPNHEGEYDDADLLSDLAREGRLAARVLKGQGFDLGQPRGLAAAREAWLDAGFHAP